MTEPTPPQTVGPFFAIGLPWDDGPAVVERDSEGAVVLRGTVYDGEGAPVPDALVDPLTKFFVNSTSCVPPFVQLAGVAALRGPQDEPRAMVEEFRARRDLIVDGLRRLPGVTCRVPKGAFYAFPNVAEVPIDADELASRLLEEAGVAVLSGSAFGRVGKDNLRLSYANSRANLSAALERMDSFLRSIA